MNDILALPLFPTCIGPDPLWLNTHTWFSHRHSLLLIPISGGKGLYFALLNGDLEQIREALPATQVYRFLSSAATRTVATAALLLCRLSLRFCRLLFMLPVQPFLLMLRIKNGSRGKSLGRRRWIQCGSSRGSTGGCLLVAKQPQACGKAIDYGPHANEGSCLHQE